MQISVNQVILYSVILTVILMLIMTLIVQAIITNQQQQFNQYANAPDCNGTIPQTEGICKWSNRTWIMCEKPLLSDVHLKDTVWCKPVELYDVTT
jgi:hypothetical protein